MIEINNITIKYDRVLYENQSIILKPGTITLIEGESGLGKTTLLYIIGMLLKPKDCIYKWNDKIIEDEETYRRNISYVMQNNDLIDYLNVEEHFQLSTSQQEISKDRMNEILKYVDLEISLDQNIKSLSSGEKQRLAIAIALSNNTQVILLDEPTSYLDDERSQSVMKLLNKIAEDDKIIVIVSHDKMIEKYASVIYMIEDKKINLVKDLECKKQIKQKKSKINLDYYKTYIRYYIKYHKLSILLNIMLISLCVTFLIMLSSVVDKFLDQQDKNLQDLSTNQVLMINSQSQFYDENAELLSDDTIEKIKKIDGIENIYSYSENYIQVNKITVTICPYHNIEDIKEYTEIEFKNTGKYFISNELYKVIKGNQLSIEDKNYDITAVLKQGYNATYNEDNHYVLYVPEEEIETRNGNYIIMFNDYKKIDAVSQQLENQYNVSIVNKENSSILLDSYSLANIVGKLLSILIYVISIVFLLIINYQTIKNQKHSFAFLKVNSLNYKKIEITHYLLLLAESIIIWLLFICIQFIYIFIINIMYNISIPYMIDIINAIKFIVIFMLVVNIPAIYGIHFNDPIKNIR